MDMSEWVNVREREGERERVGVHLSIGNFIPTQLMESGT